jgi:nucleoside-diphosphate-sugar epimerase
MKQKILIVGGAGYIGGFLTDLLIDNSYDVTLYDSLVYESRYLKDVKFINGDVRDTEKLVNILKDFDTVVWLAAIVGDGACAVDASLTNEVNFLAVKWLVDNYKGRIMFPSTCSVYGINNDLIDESAMPNPQSMYASTKLAAEQYIITNCKDCLIFRLGTLFGISDTYSRLRLDLVVNALTTKAVRGEKLTVFGGEQWRPLLHVKDVSTAILHGLQNDIKGLYNLSNKNYTIYELALEIQKLIPQSEVLSQDLKFEDMRNYKVKNDKYVNTGWTPKFTLQDGILEIKQIIEQDRIKNIKDSVYFNANYIKGLFK